jgi:hypothetical protein
MAEYSFENEDESETPMFFSRKAMSTLPSYDDGNYHYRPKRTDPVSPYKGQHNKSKYNCSQVYYLKVIFLMHERLRTS